MPEGTSCTWAGKQINDFLYQLGISSEQFSVIQWCQISLKHPRIKTSNENCDQLGIWRTISIIHAFFSSTATQFDGKSISFYVKSLNVTRYLKNIFIKCICLWNKWSARFYVLILSGLCHYSDPWLNSLFFIEK